MSDDWRDDDSQSGVVVARLFHRLLAVVFLVAWASLGVQVLELIGSRGLIPAHAFLTNAGESGHGFAALPTVFWVGSSDTLLQAGIWAGAALALCAFSGFYPRSCCALSTLLYLSYVTVARPFLSFQWDNLLLECGALAVFLPRDRQARWIHFLFRLLLFKLYWESGIAKWQSHLGDWQDGSAMTSYFETAPLPTWLAWYAHALPSGWHRFESWAVLALELILPLAIFGPRSARLFTAVAFTGFQLANIATANYGFFAYLTIVLHLFLLGDRDLKSLPRWITQSPDLAFGGQRFRVAGHGEATPSRAAGIAGAALIVIVYVGVSVADAWLQFARPASGWARSLATVQTLVAPWRLINTYHLFGHITRERIEPEFQTFDGNEWRPLAFHFKPGDPGRPPPFVAPHQPRVDFQLWFYGLGFRQGAPGYVVAIADRLCNDPAALRHMFETAIPVAPQAVRIVFWQYHFTTVEERRRTGAWWTRSEIASSRPHSCR